MAVTVSIRGGGAEKPAGDPPWDRARQCVGIHARVPSWETGCLSLRLAPATRLQEGGGFSTCLQKAEGCSDLGDGIRTVHQDPLQA